MARKKMKLDENYLWNDRQFIIDDYHRVVNNNDKTIKGVRYRLANRLTQEQKDYILSFKNTIISDCYLKYAPEIKYDVVIILDKCIKKNEVK